MYLIKGSAGLKNGHTASVVTIGNFDGVHRGHQQVIEKLAEAGRRLNLPLVVILFEPQPREYFTLTSAPPRLMSLREKLACLGRLPVDAVLLLRFTQKLANLTAETFIEDILIRQLGVRHLVVGDDFRFGLNRRGTFELLQTYGQQHGFQVADTPSVVCGGVRVSSTRIREALQQGQMTLVTELLGRTYSIQGRVIHGEKRGRTLGFPTANVNMNRQNSAIRGVFAVTLTTPDGCDYPGVANVGQRPTIRRGQRINLETYLFDFCGDLYGQRVEVQFHHRIREERRFAHIDELRAQITRDAEAARNYLTNRPRESIT
ncbi:MAG: bifunctional riboflavin kinase/FAD synthetase [Methylococcaceae bacterium]